MKNSVLLSGIAAFSLIITFAETSLRHNENRISLASADRHSVVTVEMASMLPGVEILGNRKKAADPTTLVIPSEAFSYLKFDVNKYSEADAENPEAKVDLPEASEADYSYLKFDVNDYTSTNEADSHESIEMPANDFDYLKFDVKNFQETDDLNSVEITDIPVNEFSYLKFDVTKYYGADNRASYEGSEMPESAK